MKANSPYDIVIRPLVTEKAVEQSEKERTYWFEVDASANKNEIRRAVEEIYSVHVSKVNTARIKGKPRRMRWRDYREKDWKKAAVTLVEGERIDII